jgi:hypothetical protein
MALSSDGQLQRHRRWSAFTFLGGIGAALMAPTWQAIVPELVGEGGRSRAPSPSTRSASTSRAPSARRWAG